MNEFGTAIKKRCKELGIMYKDLNKACGLSDGYISRYSRGASIPTRETVEKIELNLGFGKGELERLVVRKEIEYSSRYTPSIKERRILEAWDRGRLSPEDVAKVTGYSIKTVGKYLPLSGEEV